MSSKTIIVTATPDISKSKAFYQKLNYQVIPDTERVIFRDGNLIVEVEPNRFARPGLKFYKENWDDVIAELEQLTQVIETDLGLIASDPNGVTVYLVDKKWAESGESDTESAMGLTGNFAGVSIEAVDTGRTARFWETIGYKHKEGDLDSGWATFENNSNVDLSIMKALMCPHLFFNPGLTFFNGTENLKIIEKIKAAEIRVTEEITHFNEDGIADNIIIRDPGGLGFFIFND